MSDNPHRLTPERVRFELAMRRAGWRMYCDLFGKTRFWRHTITERETTDQAALEYWQETGEAPVPF